MALLYRMGTGNGSGSNIKPYTVNFECASGYIGQTITMKQSGQDNVSGIVGSDGKLTLYPMYSGEWECSCYSSVIGTTTIKTIDLSYWGVQPTVTFEDTPNGATVTPTDDVQTWLHCANVWNKSYTTISEVVADTTTLNTLIANENANDYLVRSTTFATDICSNESAMTYIGLNDYCANKLLADSTWLKAICSTSETLLKKVLNVYVPKMTSNTAPSGEASASSTYNTNSAWKAFDDTSAAWGRNLSASAPHWLQYKFPTPMIIKAIGIEATGRRSFKYKLQGDDGTGLTEVIPNQMNATETYTITDINNNKSYITYRILVVSEDDLECGVRELQFYGREEA